MEADDRSELVKLRDSRIEMMEDLVERLESFPANASRAEIDQEAEAIAPLIRQIDDTVNKMREKAAKEGMVGLDEFRKFADGESNVYERLMDLIRDLYARRGGRRRKTVKRKTRKMRKATKKSRRRV
jgi:hypothetical protein